MDVIDTGVKTLHPQLGIRPISKLHKYNYTTLVHPYLDEVREL